MICETMPLLAPNFAKDYRQAFLRMNSRAHNLGAGSEE
jgi:hypothetical protein